MIGLKYMFAHLYCFACAFVGHPAVVTHIRYEAVAERIIQGHIYTYIYI